MSQWERKGRLTWTICGSSVKKEFHVGGLKKLRMNNKITSRSSKRKSQIQVRVPHLSKEIIFNILVRLPAEIVYEAIRYVCVEWYNIVRDPYFVNAHLQQSTSILFLQSHDFPEFAYSVEVTETDIKMTKLLYPFRGPVWASCDGLVLYGDVLNRYKLHVANPVTKQHVSLPPILHPTSVWDLSSSGLAYAASTRDYKVVHVYEEFHTTSTSSTIHYHCVILTLGIDCAWREIDLKNTIIGSNHPCSAGGFIYWYNHEIEPSFPCLDVDTEEFHQISPPITCGKYPLRLPVLMGSLLSFVSQLNEFLYEVWVLIKPRTGEWIRMPNIVIEGQRHIYYTILFPHEYNSNHLLDTADMRKKLELLDPIAWVKNGEVMIFRLGSLSNTIIAHNLKTGQVYSLDLDEHMLTDGVSHRPHIHSLVSFRSQLV